jgi:hypothetical protein
MIRVEDHVPIRGSARDGFLYLADFTNLPAWDPGISRVSRVDSGPLRVGSRFEVVARFLGRDVPMGYEVVVYDEAAQRAELLGTSPGLRATDRITVSPRGAGAEVHWQADFELLGARRLVEPLMRPLFARLARKAMGGLAARLG